MDSLDEQPATAVAAVPEKKEESSVSKKYKLVNVVGVGNQLQATLEEVSTGQNRRIAVGKELDGYIVKSISVVLTSDDPADLYLMSKYRKRIERAIVNKLNQNVVGRDKNDNGRN